jgi:hypothetical protein
MRRERNRQAYPVGCSPPVKRPLLDEQRARKSPCRRPKKDRAERENREGVGGAAAPAGLELQVGQGSEGRTGGGINPQAPSHANRSTDFRCREVERQRLE